MPYEWHAQNRPGYLGANRDRYKDGLDETYGPGNWRFGWLLSNNHFTDFLGACALYEDSYFDFLLSNQQHTARLIKEASDVYDDAESNMQSGLDYNIQETNRTHVQDIAIRRCLVRLGVWFEGKEPIRIRQEKGSHPLSYILSPGMVPFHRPDLIMKPSLAPSWAHQQTVEDFYQSNRWVMQKVEVVPFHQLEI